MAGPNAIHVNVVVAIAQIANLDALKTSITVDLTSRDGGYWSLQQGYASNASRLTMWG
jgi:hypothetical protein